MSPVELAERLRTLVLETEPWPHGIIDDALPVDVYADLVNRLPSLDWNGDENARRAKNVPQAVREILAEGSVVAAVRERFSLWPVRVVVEAAWFGAKPGPPHEDRPDKVFGGQIYLTGDPKGTELYDFYGGDEPARVIEWQNNRLSCWPRPPAGLRHAVPTSRGRTVLLWWLLRA